MHIVDVRIHALIVPMRHDTVHSAGVDDKLCRADHFSGRSLNFWEFSKWIVELVADNGLIGLGEPRRGDIRPLLEECARAIIGKSLPELPIGALPLPRGSDYDSCIAYEAFEMAWLDLLSKHLGVPVWYLLGGKAIDRVPVDYWMGRCTPEDTARRTLRAVKMGFRGVKMKCVASDQVVERVRAVRSVAPHFSIVLDPNERFYDPEQTIKISRALENFDRLILESPMPQQRLDWYAAVRGKIAHKLALHLASLKDLLDALRAQAADCFNLLSTLTDFVNWARVAQTAGCAVWRGSGVDLGVRDMSSVHAVAAAGCSLPSDLIGSFLREDDLIVSPVPFDAGHIRVPDAPGLGIELDRKALEGYRVR